MSDSYAAVTMGATRIMIEAVNETVNDTFINTMETGQDMIERSLGVSMVTEKVCIAYISIWTKKTN